jgi:formylglycine-generating enzyme required for sulfatase activity
MRYPGGCTNKSIILTSRYVAPKAGVRALAVTNAGASFSASPGSLASPFVNQLAWGANNRVTNRSSNRLVMTITNSTGLFAGSVVDPASGATLVYKGALLQDRNYGSGLILLPAEQKATGQMHVEDLYCVERKGMACIDPGWFMMGSPATEKDRVSTEGPQTQVTISHPFWMGNYPVTQAEFEAVKGYNPSTVVGAHLPVQSLNWLEANNYCELLTEQERAANRLPAGYVYRLPTEAEWEYACRAGTSTRFGYGDDLNYTSLGNYAWYTSNSGWALHDVGLKLPNPWGLYDMHGNVYQWCMDGFGTYPGGSVTDPVAPMVNGVMVARGGSYISSAAGCRSAFRVNVYLADYYGILGFRVVLAPALP